MLTRKIWAATAALCLIPSLAGFAIPSTASVDTDVSQPPEQTDTARSETTPPVDRTQDTPTTPLPKHPQPPLNPDKSSSEESSAQDISSDDSTSDKSSSSGTSSDETSSSGTSRSAAKIEVYSKTLKPGMKGDVIVSLQEGLKKFYPRHTHGLKVTGIFDSATFNALKAIQSANGIFPDGLYGMKTARELHRKGMSLWILPKISSSTALSYGQHSGKIAALQSWLYYTYSSTFSECNFYNIDGIYGHYTRKCIVKVAREYGFSAHGAIDDKVTKGLASHGIDITVKAPPKIGQITPSRTLWKGDYGTSVKRIQTFFGYYFPHYTPYKPDAGFGSLTRKTIINFQKAHGINPDGGYGNLTAQAMRRYGINTWILPTVKTQWDLVKSSAANDYVTGAKSWLGYGFPKYCSLKINGYFDAEMQRCVNRVRAHYSLTENGKIDPALSKKLVKDNYKIYVAKAPSPWRSLSTKVLRSGDRGSAVKNIQIALNKYFPDIAGFYPDGIYGAKTKAAIKALQRRNGVTPDGSVGMWTSRIFAKHNIPIVVIPRTTFTTTLKKGHRGGSVLAMQLGLTHFYPSQCSFTPDAVFGSQTEQCLKNVQKKSGIYPDGKFGSTTAGLLRKHGVPIYTQGYRAPAGYLQPTTHIKSLGGRTNMLTWGMNGVKVKIVQKRLGIWGPSTLASVDGRVTNAVRTFQRRAGLKADGIVGQRTWTALRTGYPWKVDQYQASPIGLDATRSQRIERMISYAMAQRGTSYTWGGAGYSSLGYDCSGLVLQSLYSAGLDPQPIDVVKHAWPAYRTSRELYAHPRLKHVPLSQRQRGDIIFYHSGGTVHHVAIYLGGNQVIHTDWMGRPARVQHITLGWGWSKLTSTVVRPFP